MWGIRSQSTSGRGRESDGSKERPRWKIVSYACTNVKNEKVNQFDKKGFGKSYYFASSSRTRNIVSARQLQGDDVQILTLSHSESTAFK